MKYSLSGISQYNRFEKALKVESAEEEQGKPVTSHSHGRACYWAHSVHHVTSSMLGRSVWDMWRASSSWKSWSMALPWRRWSATFLAASCLREGTVCAVVVELHTVGKGRDQRRQNHFGSRGEAAEMCRAELLGFKDGKEQLLSMRWQFRKRMIPMGLASRQVNIIRSNWGKFLSICPTKICHDYQWLTCHQTQLRGSYRGVKKTTVSFNVKLRPCNPAAKWSSTWMVIWSPQHRFHISGWSWVCWKWCSVDLFIVDWLIYEWYHVFWCLYKRFVVFLIGQTITYKEKCWS